MPPQTLQPAASYSPPPTDSGGGALQPAASYSPPPQQGAPQQGAPQQGAPPQDPDTPEDGTMSGWWKALLKDNTGTAIMNRVGHSPSEFVHNFEQYAKDTAMGPVRSATTGAQNAMTFIRDKTGTQLLDKGIDTNDQFLRATAPQSVRQQQNYQVGDTIGAMLLTHGLEQGLSGVQLARSLKVAPVLEKLATENPHIAQVIGAGLRSGTANAASTAAMGGSLGDILNSGLMGAGFGTVGELPNARASYETKAAAKYRPDVTKIGDQTFTEVSKAATDKGITSQEQEPGLQAKNQQSYQNLRDQDLRQRAAQGTADTVNAMEPEQPPVSVAGAQRLKAKTSVSTAPPEPPNTDASPREIDQQQRYLQKVIDSKKFPQAIKDKAQAQLDKINTQQQAVTDFKNNPDNYRTETPISPKVLMQNSSNFGEFADEINRQAERRTPDKQWHERQYDSNGEVQQDASGNEVWKPVDINSMSRTQQDAGIQDGDLAKRDVRNLSAVDIKQGLRMGRMAEASKKLDDVTQSIYDLSRERTESIQKQTNQPNLTQEMRTANMQGQIDKLEALSKEYGPEFNDMFGRKDGITDLIAASKKIGYGDNGAKYSGTLSDYFMKTLTKRTSLAGKGGFGAGTYLLAKAIGLPHTVATLGTEAAVEAAHRGFMHKIATDPDYANKVLTKDRSPKAGIRFTASTLANIGSQVAARGAVSDKVQGDGGASSQEVIE